MHNYTVYHFIKVNINGQGREKGKGTEKRDSGIRTLKYRKETSTGTSLHHAENRYIKTNDANINNIIIL